MRGRRVAGLDWAGLDWAQEPRLCREVGEDVVCVWRKENVKEEDAERGRRGAVRVQRSNDTLRLCQAGTKGKDEGRRFTHDDSSGSGGSDGGGCGGQETSARKQAQSQKGFYFVSCLVAVAELVVDVVDRRELEE